MGTIVDRKRRDGSMGYTARVRIMRDGKTYSETETFDRRAAAQAWIKKRETELATPGAIDKAVNPEPTLAHIIERYLTEITQHRKIGRTKEATLKAIAAHEIGRLKASEVKSVELVNYARQRLLEDEVLPQTVQNDIVLLGSVFAVAEAAWGYQLDNAEMTKAKAVAKQMGMIQKSTERTRVPTMAELDMLMAHFQDASRRREWSVPMLKLVAFAIFSTRRQEEITLLRWDDINMSDKTILVRDVKHPRHKIGNNHEASLTDEALQLIHSMPRVSDRIFPFTTDAVSAQFTRACDWLGIDDLRFHDLRRAGVTRLFEMGWDIPRVASVSLHRDWNSLRRYTNMKQIGDRYAGWKWFKPALDLTWEAGRRVTAETRKKAPAEARAKPQQVRWRSIATR